MGHRLEQKGPKIVTRMRGWASRETGQQCVKYQLVSCHIRRGYKSTTHHKKSLSFDLELVQQVDKAFGIHHLDA